MALLSREPDKLKSQNIEYDKLEYFTASQMCLLLLKNQEIDHELKDQIGKQ
jgi:hypothetical protein